MIVAIYGSAGDSDDIAIRHAKEIGRLLAQRGHTVITGGSPGAPYEAVLSAFQLGGHTVGYSPAISRHEHVNVLQDPVDGYSELVFVPENYVYADNIVARYKYRNVSTAMASDRVIVIGGRYGTLDEFILAYELGKEIGVLRGTGGAAEVISTGIIELALEKIHKDTGAKVHIKDSPSELLDAMGL